MQMTKDYALKNMELLLQASDELEKRLVDAGFDPHFSHMGLFYFKDALWDWHSMQLRVIDVFNMSNAQQIPDKLASLAVYVYDALLPIITDRMKELAELVETTLPTSEFNMDDDSQASDDNAY